MANKMTEIERIWLEDNYDKPISEIASQLGRSKSTVNSWLIQYKESRNLTKENRLSAGRIAAGKSKAMNAANKASNFAIHLFESNKSDVDFMVGLALYWSEGTKKRFSFSNGDPHMIRVFTKWIKKYFANSTMSCYIHAPQNNYESAYNYWLNELGDNYTNFKLMDASINTRLAYGIATINISGLTSANIVIRTLLDLMRQHYN